jgi:hypothetical protein
LRTALLAVARLPPAIAVFSRYSPAGREPKPEARIDGLVVGGQASLPRLSRAWAREDQSVPGRWRLKTEIFRPPNATAG